MVVGLLIIGFAFRCVSSGIVSWGSSGEKDVGDSSTFPWSALPDEQGGPALLGSNMVTAELTFKTSREENENFLRRILFRNRFFFTKSFTEETRDIGQELEKCRYAMTERVFRSVAK